MPDEEETISELMGIKFDPPIKMAVVSKLFFDARTGTTKYLENMVLNNTEFIEETGLKKHEGQSLELIRAAIKETMQNFANENDVFICILDRDLNVDKKFENKSDPSVKSAKKKKGIKAPIKKMSPKLEAITHKRLRDENNSKVLPREDASTIELLSHCGNLVLETLQGVKKRSKVILTKDKITEMLENRMSKTKHGKPTVKLPDDWKDRLISTLVEDSWVLFEHKNEIAMIPYGEGLPTFDKKQHSSYDHIIWNGQRIDLYVDGSRIN